VPREQNQEADALSKAPDADDWQLRPELFEQLSRRHGPFEVDLFASELNCQVATYSRWHTPTTAGVNAFAHRWGRAAWCCPPPTLTGRVLAHAQDCGARMCLVVPLWPNQKWWHRLVEARGSLFQGFVRDCTVLPRGQGTYVAGPSIKLARASNWLLRKEESVICASLRGAGSKTCNTPPPPERAHARRRRPILGRSSAADRLRRADAGDAHTGPAADGADRFPQVKS
jgi:hypothetical protein